MVHILSRRFQIWDSQTLKFAPSRMIFFWEACLKEKRFEKVSTKIWSSVGQDWVPFVHILVRSNDGLQGSVYALFAPALESTHVLGCPWLVGFGCPWLMGSTACIHPSTRCSEPFRCIWAVTSHMAPRMLMCCTCKCICPRKWTVHRILFT